MLPKDRRIPRKLFGYLLEQKRYFNSEHLTLMVGPKDATGPRVAASVSKKISKSAVARNTVRRRIYSSARLVLPGLAPNLFLLVAKRGIEKVKAESLSKEVYNLFKSGGFIVSEPKKS